MSRRIRRERRQFRRTANWDAIAAALTTEDVAVLREFSALLGASWDTDRRARDMACDVAFAHVRDGLIADGHPRGKAEAEAASRLGLPPGMARMLRRLRTVQSAPEEEAITIPATINEAPK